MNTHILESVPKPIVFAHRGASKYAPENTMAAFRLALEQGAKAIELDAMLSADKKVMVIHDPVLDRTTNGKGKVKNYTASSLQRLDAGSWYSEGFLGEKIPLLEEVLRELGGKCLINIELKNYQSPRDSLTEEVASLVRDMHMQNSILFSSFLPGNIRKMSNYLPSVPVALLALSGLPGKVMRSFLFRKISPKFINISLEDVSGKYIKKEHKEERRVNVYTVNKANQMQKLFNMEVDGIFTDDPKLAFEVLRKIST